MSTHFSNFGSLKSTETVMTQIGDELLIISAISAR